MHWCSKIQDLLGPSGGSAVRWQLPTSDHSNWIPPLQVMWSLQLWPQMLTIQTLTMQKFATEFWARTNSSPTSLISTQSVGPSASLLGSSIERWVWHLTGKNKPFVLADMAKVKVKNPLHLHQTVSLTLFMLMLIDWDDYLSVFPPTENPKLHSGGSGIRHDGRWIDYNCQSDPYCNRQEPHSSRSCNRQDPHSSRSLVLCKSSGSSQFAKGLLTKTGSPESTSTFVSFDIWWTLSFVSPVEVKVHSRGHQRGLSESPKIWSKNSSP